MRKRKGKKEWKKRREDRTKQFRDKKGSLHTPQLVKTEQAEPGKVPNRPNAYSINLYTHRIEKVREDLKKT